MITLVSWNLHGRGRPDLDEVADRLRAFEPDVVALQEVHRRQAVAVAHRLGWEARWSFKHFPLVAPREGLAVLTPHHVDQVERVTLSRWAPPWSHRRRIAQVVRLDAGGQCVDLCNVHLASGSPGQRLAQAGRLLAVLPSGALVAGDLNAAPDSDVLVLLRSAGLRDVQTGPTHGARRIDYVLAPGDGSGETAASDISDHLPVVAHVSPSR